MALSNKIRELRFNNSEITQKQLAGRVGISRQSMNAIENGRYAPTIEVAIRIADVFGVTVDELFDLDYAGRPARHQRTSTTAAEQSEAVVEKSDELETDGDPAEEKSGRKPTFAHLAKVIDS